MVTMCVYIIHLQEISAYEMKRLQNIERNNQELARLGLKAPVKKTAMTTKNQDQGEDQCSSDREALRISSIGKYTYQITPADLQKEQQAFQAGEGVNICVYIYIYIILYIMYVLCIIYLLINYVLCRKKN